MFIKNFLFMVNKGGIEHMLFRRRGKIIKIIFI